MSKGEHRRFTAEQKLEILRQAEQPGVTVSAVCRRHSLAPSVLPVARGGAEAGCEARAAQRRYGGAAQGADPAHGSRDRGDYGGELGAQKIRMARGKEIASPRRQIPCRKSSETASIARNTRISTAINSSSKSFLVHGYTMCTGRNYSPRKLVSNFVRLSTMPGRPESCKAA
jgi:transposase-like protein